MTVRSVVIAHTINFDRLWTKTLRLFVTACRVKPSHAVTSYDVKATNRLQPSFAQSERLQPFVQSERLQPSFAQSERPFPDRWNRLTLKLKFDFFFFLNTRPL